MPADALARPCSRSRAKRRRRLHVSPHMSNRRKITLASGPLRVMPPLDDDSED